MAQRHPGDQLGEAVGGVLVEAHGEVVEILLLGEVQAGDEQRRVVAHRLLVPDELVRTGGQDLAPVVAQQGDAVAPVDGDEAGPTTLPVAVWVPAGTSRRRRSPQDSSAGLKRARMASTRSIWSASAASRVRPLRSLVRSPITMSRYQT